MAAYRRFTDTNRRIASSASLLPIESCPLDSLEPANASRIVVLISASSCALEILHRRADDHLIDFHIDRLLDCVSDRSLYRAGRDGHFHELAQILSGRFVRAALRQFGGNRAR